MLLYNDLDSLLRDWRAGSLKRPIVLTTQAQHRSLHGSIIEWNRRHPGGQLPGPMVAEYDSVLPDAIPEMHTVRFDGYFGPPWDELPVAWREALERLSAAGALARAVIRAPAIGGPASEVEGLQIESVFAGLSRLVTESSAGIPVSELRGPTPEQVAKATREMLAQPMPEEPYGRSQIVSPVEYEALKALDAFNPGWIAREIAEAQREVAEVKSMPKHPSQQTEEEAKMESRVAHYGDDEAGLQALLAECTGSSSSAPQRALFLCQTAEQAAEVARRVRAQPKLKAKETKWGGRSYYQFFFGNAEVGVLAMDLVLPSWLNGCKIGAYHGPRLDALPTEWREALQGALSPPDTGLIIVADPPDTGDMLCGSVTFKARTADRRPGVYYGDAGFDEIATDWRMGKFATGLVFTRRQTAQYEARLLSLALSAAWNRACDPSITREAIGVWEWLNAMHAPGRLILADMTRAPLSVVPARLDAYHGPALADLPHDWRRAVARALGQCTCGESEGCHLCMEVTDRPHLMVNTQTDEVFLACSCGPAEACSVCMSKPGGKAVEGLRLTSDMTPVRVNGKLVGIGVPVPQACGPSDVPITLASRQTKTRPVFCTQCNGTGMGCLYCQGGISAWEVVDEVRSRPEQPIGYHESLVYPTLLDCAHCGSEAHMDVDPEGASVECTGCGIVTADFIPGGSFMLQDCINDAAEDWNRRDGASGGVQAALAAPASTVRHFHNLDAACEAFARSQVTSVLVVRDTREELAKARDAVVAALKKYLPKCYPQCTPNVTTTRVHFMDRGFTFATTEVPVDWWPVCPPLDGYQGPETYKLAEPHRTHVMRLVAREDPPIFAPSPGSGRLPKVLVDAVCADLRTHLEKTIGELGPELHVDVTNDDALSGEGWCDRLAAGRRPSAAVPSTVLPGPSRQLMHFYDLDAAGRAFCESRVNNVLIVCSTLEERDKARERVVCWIAQVDRMPQKTDTRVHYGDRGFTFVCQEVSFGAEIPGWVPFDGYHGPSLDGPEFWQVSLKNWIDHGVSIIVSVADDGEQLYGMPAYIPYVESAMRKKDQDEFKRYLESVLYGSIAHKTPIIPFDKGPYAALVDRIAAAIILDVQSLPAQPADSETWRDVVQSQLRARWKELTPQVDTVITSNDVHGSVHVRVTLKDAASLQQPADHKQEQDDLASECPFCGGDGRVDVSDDDYEAWMQCAYAFIQARIRGEQLVSGPQSPAPVFWQSHDGTLCTGDRPPGGFLNGPECLPPERICALVADLTAQVEALKTAILTAHPLPPMPAVVAVRCDTREQAERVVELLDQELTPSLTIDGEPAWPWPPALIPLGKAEGLSLDVVEAKRAQQAGKAADAREFAAVVRELVTKGREG